MTTLLSPNDLKSRIDGSLLCFPLTDFSSDTKSFDAERYRDRLDWLGAFGVNALFPAAGAGEYFSLSEKEYESILDDTIRWSGGNVPVIASAGMGTMVAIAHAKKAEAMGADGILLLPPYLTETSQDGLCEHIAAICSAVSIGIIIYNRGNCRLTPPTVAKLAERCANLIGIKDGIGNIEWLLGMRSLVGNRLLYINGMPTAEVYATAYKAMGAGTYSSAILNFLPRTAVDFHAAIQSGDAATCDNIFSRFLRPYLEIRNRQPGYAVSIVKAGADIIGRSAGPVRLPLSSLTSEEREALTQLIREMGNQDPL